MTKKWKIFILVDRYENEMDQKILELFWASPQEFNKIEDAELILSQYEGDDELTILPIYMK